MIASFQNVSRIALTFGAVCLGAVAQDEATTLSRLLDSSDAVVVARVHRVVATTPQRTGRQFVREQVLLGACPATFVLDEPAAASCGRAIHGLLAGQRVVLFLDNGTNGPTLRTSGARGLSLATQAVVDHLRALSRTTDPVGRATIAAASLDNPDDRVRTDAALDLPYLPGLAAASPPLTSRIRRALDAREPTLPSLVLAASRLGEEGAIDALLPAYLESERPEAGADLTGFLKRSLLRFDHGAVARRMAGVPITSSQAQLRAVGLLAGLGSTEAQPVLFDLLRTTPTRSVAVAAARALLDAGAHSASVAALTHPTVMEAARLEPRTTRFRSVLRNPTPGGQR